jgi:hypothetical protein
MSRKYYIIVGQLNVAGPAPFVIHSLTPATPAADSKATDSQLGDIATLGYCLRPEAMRPGIWLRRANARKACASMNALNNGYTYSVKGVGQFKRTVRPVKGYTYFRPDEKCRWWLEDWAGPASSAAGKAKIGDYLIPTRALARAALPEQQKHYEGHRRAASEITGYGKLRIVPVYADA